jgi:hypothetical protein
MDMDNSFVFPPVVKKEANSILKQLTKHNNQVITSEKKPVANHRLFTLIFSPEAYLA